MENISGYLAIQKTFVLSTGRLQKALQGYEMTLLTSEPKSIFVFGGELYFMK